MHVFFMLSTRFATFLASSDKTVNFLDLLHRLFMFHLPSSNLHALHNLSFAVCESLLKIPDILSYQFCPIPNARFECCNLFPPSIFIYLRLLHFLSNPNPILSSLSFDIKLNVPLKYLIFDRNSYWPLSSDLPITKINKNLAENRFSWKLLILQWYSLPFIVG